MAALAAAVPYIGPAMAVMGAVQAFSGNQQNADTSMVIGQRQQEAAAFEAEQAKINAGQAIAASQREAANTDLQTRLVQSRALALAAAGGGASDPSVINLLARTAGEGVYQRGIALYQGEEKARQFRMAAAAKNYEGAVALEGAQAQAGAYRTRATSSLLSGAGSALSMFTRYGGGGPGAAAAAGDGALISDAASYAAMMV